MKLYFAQGNRFLYLVLITLALTISTALATNTKVVSSVVEKITKANFFGNPSPLPVLSETATFPVLSAQGVIAVDIASGVHLYEKNVNLKLLPASTTKIMTALVAMDVYTPETIVTIGKIKVEGQKMGLKMGERISIDNLLHGLLMYSANDAAEALAGAYEGGRDGFVTQMNLKASELSLQNTHFANPAGLDEDGQYSTAGDMVRLSEIAMRDLYFAKIVSTKERVIYDESGKHAYNLVNINKLLGTVDGVVGIKTGWTEAARENLVTYVIQSDRPILIALLGSQDRFGETKELIDWLYKSYTWQNISYSP